jgi:hypothetical protein
MATTTFGAVPGFSRNAGITVTLHKFLIARLDFLPILPPAGERSLFARLPYALAANRGIHLKLITA